MVEGGSQLVGDVFRFVVGLRSNYRLLRLTGRNSKAKALWMTLAVMCIFTAAMRRQDKERKMLRMSPKGH